MKNEILKLYRKHQFTRFGEHNELLGLVVCAENFYDDYEKQEFDEVVFAVEKEWLINYLNEKSLRVDWDGDRVKQWLIEEYTSDDSYEIFYAAMEDHAIAILEFN